MTTLEFAEVTGSQIARSGDKSAEQGSGLDLALIRKRVAAIKSGWTPEVAKARACEGEKRRDELYRLLIEIDSSNDRGSGPVGKSSRSRFGLVG